MKKYLDILCDKLDLDSLSLIQNKLFCASQAARIEAIPNNVSELKVKLFDVAVIFIANGTSYSVSK